ncbi:MAG: tRNA (adenosine(37)-N6)-threonylcarbamoyltransferase complex dimerization subunit type 1 TsaB, partial [Anaerolineaceae bacterium]|nr:tRNA (adenosine(37)-N6)-threonylcarbamoyltransferase complex dimerization subunit type 1 TsaB [Anaerolineaceae bacterium]
MLLAVDTSTQFMGICLYDEGQVIGEMVWRTNRHHTVELAPSIDILLHRCGVEVKNLSALAVALGPGSFTSLRIGLSHLKGMSLALHLPMIGIPTLDALAYAQPGDGKPLVACLQAGRKRLAFQCYHWKERKGWQTEGEPQLAYAADFGE